MAINKFKLLSIDLLPHDKCSPDQSAVSAQPYQAIHMSGQSIATASILRWRTSFQSMTNDTAATGERGREHHKEPHYRRQIAVKKRTKSGVWDAGREVEIYALVCSVQHTATVGHGKLFIYGLIYGAHLSSRGQWPKPPLSSWITSTTFCDIAAHGNWLRPIANGLRHTNL